MKDYGIKSKLNNFFKSDKNLKIFVAIGLAGIILIFISSLSEGESGTSEPRSSANVNSISNKYSDDYQKQLEKQLTSILENISGVGEVKVLITIDGTTEYIYAEENTFNNDSSEDKTSENYENHVVIIENNGNKEALVKKIVKPQVSGVIVACKGGGNANVKEQVYTAVSTVLNIPVNRICVAVLK